MPEPSLMDAAKQEADAAEAEYANMTPAQRKAALKKSAAAKPRGTANGHANGVASGPGEDGSATQEPAIAPPYTPPDPTGEQVEAAGEVYAQLKARVQDYGPEQTVLALVQIVDVIPPFVTPAEWPGEEDEEYRQSGTIAEIASFLLRGCKKLEMEPSKLVCLWRNKEKWTSREVTVRGASTTFNGRTRFLLKGKQASIEINYHHFKTLNPLQKVFAVYHELRGLGAEGAAVAPDFIGYFDELEIFGPRVFREMVALANALKRGAEQRYPDQYQLSMLDEMEPAAAS